MSEFAYRDDADYVGWCHHARIEGSSRLNAIVAVKGELLDLHFVLPNDQAIESALNLWRDVLYRPPAWIHLANSRALELFALRQSIEHGRDILNAVDAAVSQHGPAVPRDVLLQALLDNRAEVREAAATGLAAVAGDQQVITVLQQLLTDPSILVQVTAIESLYHLGVQPNALVGLLIEIITFLKGEELPTGEARIKGICETLSVPTRYHAIRVLIDMNPSSEEVDGMLADFLQDLSGPVRILVAQHLANEDRWRPQIQDALIEGLTNTAMSGREQEAIATALLSLGIGTVDATNRLKETQN